MATTNLNQSATIHSQHRQTNQNKLLLTSAHHHHHHHQSLYQTTGPPAALEASQMFQLATAAQQQHQHPLIFQHQPNQPLQVEAGHHEADLESAVFQAHHPLIEAHASSNNPLIDRFFNVASAANHHHHNNNNNQQQQQHHSSSQAINCRNGVHIEASSTVADCQQADPMQAIHHRPLRNISPASKSTDSSSELQFVAQHYQNQLQHQYLAKEIAPLVNVEPIESDGVIQRFRCLVRCRDRKES